jgi:hypothetical protein
MLKHWPKSVAKWFPKFNVSLTLYSFVRPEFHPVVRKVTLSVGGLGKRQGEKGG